VLFRSITTAKASIMRKAKVSRIKAADFRRMAETSKEVERERKLLLLAAELEAQAEAIEPRAEIISPI
jgi:hypothetical protein